MYCSFSLLCGSHVLVEVLSVLSFLSQTVNDIWSYKWSLIVKHYAMLILKNEHGMYGSLIWQQHLSVLLIYVLVTGFNSGCYVVKWDKLLFWQCWTLRGLCRVSDGMNSINLLTHWPLRDGYGSNFAMNFSNTVYELIPWVFYVKLVFGECQRTHLMASQHWFR